MCPYWYRSNKNMSPLFRGGLGPEIGPDFSNTPDHFFPLGPIPAHFISWGPYFLPDNDTFCAKKLKLQYACPLDKKWTRPSKISLKFQFAPAIGRRVLKSKQNIMIYLTCLFEEWSCMLKELNMHFRLITEIIITKYIKNVWYRQYDSMNPRRIRELLKWVF